MYASLDAWGLHPEIRVLVGPYLRGLSFGALPLLFYATFRRYLQGMHVVRPVMFALVTANIVNAIANWILIYGHLGVPAFGVEGSSWATTIIGSTTTARSSLGTRDSGLRRECAIVFAPHARGGPGRSATLLVNLGPARGICQCPCRRRQP